MAKQPRYKIIERTDADKPVWKKHRWSLIDTSDPGDFDDRMLNPERPTPVRFLYTEARRREKCLNFHNDGNPDWRQFQYVVERKEAKNG